MSSQTETNTTTNTADVKSAPPVENVAPKKSEDGAPKKAAPGGFAEILAAIISGGAGNPLMEGGHAEMMAAIMANKGPKPSCTNPNCKCTFGIASTPEFLAYIKDAREIMADQKLDSATYGRLEPVISDKKNDCAVVLAEINRVSGLTKWSKKERAVVLFRLFFNDRMDVVTQIAETHAGVFELLPFANEIMDIAVDVCTPNVAGLTFLCDVVCGQFTDGHAIHYERAGRLPELKYILSRARGMVIDQNDVNIAFKLGHVDMFTYFVNELKVLPAADPIDVFRNTDFSAEPLFGNVQKCIRVLVESKLWTPTTEQINSIEQLALRRSFIRNCLPDGYTVPVTAKPIASS